MKETKIKKKIQILKNKIFQKIILIKLLKNLTRMIQVNAVFVLIKQKMHALQSAFTLCVDTVFLGQQKEIKNVRNVEQIYKSKILYLYQGNQFLNLFNI